MRKKISKQTIIISGIVAVICVAGVFTAVHLLRDKSKTLVGTYSEQLLPDYTQFLPENSIKAFFDDKGGSAYCDGAMIYFENGEYKNSDTALCEAEEGGLYITTEQYGRKTPKEMAEAMGAQYIVYEDKLAVFSFKENFADKFSDIYTLEALSMKLKGASETDITNAFIKLPNFISNGTSNSVYFTEPNLNLGIQTEIYGIQAGSQDTGYEKVLKAPMIVAGQGEHGTNNTLVRVFNESQACTAQFLAFPSDVQGGVMVKTGKSGSGQNLIVAAAYDANKNSAKSIKVFDTFGSLRYSFTPKGVEAPFTIQTGKFIEGSDKDYIFVASKFSDGSRSKYELYDIDNGSFVKSIDGGFDKNISSQRIVLSEYSAENDSASYQKILVTFKESKAVYILDCSASKWENSNIQLGGNATGAYGSAFSGQIIAALNEDTFSNVQVYGSGASANLEGELVNVGFKENRFYSTFAEKNPEGYVDYAEFNHIRADLSSGIMNKLNSINSGNTAAVTKYLENTTYEDWLFKMTAQDIRKYHNQYNVWEPCFTHRWNATQATKNLVEVINKATNAPAYASIGRDNQSGEYKELESAFLIGTYADGVMDLAKLRIYPLRNFLQQLAVEFRGSSGEPEKLVDVSPVHEQEINVAGSVGDYHPLMIEGFRKYLMGLYGSVENINRRFGTNFVTESDIDAPRYDPENTAVIKESRGDWDVYGKSDYFTQWSLYTRLMVNKRILEAYREAMIAGFPPEAINAHQIPEGDAVSGFLGEADTRISPTDVVSICGTAYGGTRYGYFCSDPNNFLQLAYNGGHNNITLGEYSALSDEWEKTYAQLQYLFEHGVKFTHMILPYSESSPMYNRVKKAETAAINKLQQENNPRASATGGTGACVAVKNGDASYNIVQIGDNNKNGLLKSVKQDGSWEGSVYLVPFRAQVKLNDIDVVKNGDSYTSEQIKGLQYGDQVELTFLASADNGNTTATIEVYHGGYLLENATVKYDITSDVTPYRYVLSNQLSLEDIQIKITFSGDVNVEGMQCVSQIEEAAHKYFGDTTAAASKGGVSFDVIK